MQTRGIVIGAAGTVAAFGLAFAGIVAANADDAPAPTPTSSVGATPTVTPTPTPEPEPTVEVTVEPAPVVEEPVVAVPEPPVVEEQAPVVDVPSSEGGGTTRKFGDVQVFIPDPVQPDPSTQIGVG